VLRVFRQCSNTLGLDIISAAGYEHPTTVHCETRLTVHQGYANWTQLQEVVDNFTKFSIPLETIWTDIDYMLAYRDFEHDPRTFGYSQGKDFLDKLHSSGRYYVPIVDSAIYIPNPENSSDA
jgi:alpha-glucosidase (family GH31 glycosyl hydrolase)